MVQSIYYSDFVVAEVYEGQVWEDLDELHLF